jgi:hypothetical protein
VGVPIPAVQRQPSEQSRVFAWGGLLGEPVQQGDELIAVVAVVAGEGDQFLGLAITAPRSGLPVTRIARPRPISSSPSSRSRRSAPARVGPCCC